MPKPRPILKALPEPDLSNPPLHESSVSNPLPFAACSSRVLLFSPHVHFRATPGLADTHSPGTYDRTSIVPEKNSCAMPERGERVYIPASVRPIGGYFHPRAYEACELDAVPALLPDLSSETDESAEECVSPKSASPEPHVAVHMEGALYTSPMPIRRTHSQEEFDRALSFLPHPPAPIKRDLGKQRNALRYSRRSVAFQDAIADCDGCLGGF
ncbi:hypothetical protein C8R45DRAFT_955533 [Mycena sanguinolenta]|nr:hypothetical protein C8R45DRAFT_955533 [Mycena sanguinolenta]